VRRLALLATWAVVLGSALAACGEGSPSSKTTTSTPVADGSLVTPLRVSGGGSAQFRVPGGDNSVQEFGAEADEGELREAAEAAHSFFAARVSGEWERACALLTESQQQGLRHLAAETHGLRGGGCPAALDRLTRSVSGSLVRQLTAVDADSLRREGDSAFLIYTGAPDRTVYAVPLRLEGGAWKLGATAGTVLPGT
jgi:hypothetical protein